MNTVIPVFVWIMISKNWNDKYTSTIIVNFTQKDFLFRSIIQTKVTQYTTELARHFQVIL